MSITIRRTFHVLGEQRGLVNITEQGLTVSIDLNSDSEAVLLTRDQFEALCELRYQIKWDWPEADE